MRDFKDSCSRPLFPAWLAPCRGGIRDYGPSGEGASPHPSLPKTPVAIESLVLCVVARPLRASHGNPFPVESLHFILRLFPRSTNLQSAMTCAKPATALGVPSVPLHMWKVSTRRPTGSGLAAVVNPSEERQLTGSPDSVHPEPALRMGAGGGARHTSRVSGGGAVAGWALWGPEGVLGS